MVAVAAAAAWPVTVEGVAAWRGGSMTGRSRAEPPGLGSRPHLAAAAWGTHHRAARGAYAPQPALTPISMAEIENNI